MSAEIQKLYIAYFNRPADPGGLAYWTDQLANGATMTQIANSFSASAEYQAIYTGKSNLVLIDQLYQNLFGRAADDGGLLFWHNEMLAGRVTITSVASALASGTTPGSADNIAINSKISAATAFTTAIDTAAEQLAYAGTAAFASASAWLSTVNSVATLATAIEPATLAAAVAASSSAAGGSFTLTSEEDTPVLTTGDDLITGTTTTLSADDRILDSSTTDNDVFNLTATADPAVMDVTNVETININWNAFSTPDIDLEEVSGSTVTLSSSKAGYLGNANFTNVGENLIVLGAGISNAVAIDGAEDTTITATEAASLNIGAAANSDGAMTIYAGVATDVTMVGGDDVTLVALSADDISLTGGGDSADVTLGVDADLTFTGAADGVLTIRSEEDIEVTVEAASVYEELTVAGSGVVSLVIAAAADIDGLTVTNASGTVELTAAIADLDDYTGVTAEEIILADTAAAVCELVVASGQVFRLEEDTAAADDITFAVSTDDDSSTDTLTLILEDIQAGDLLFDKSDDEDFETVNITIDPNSAFDTDTNFTIALLSAQDDSSIVLMSDNSDVNVVVTTYDAGTLDASGVEGDFTATQVTDEDSIVIVGGGEVDITFAAVDNDSTFVGSTGGGEVNFITEGGTASATFDGGDTTVLANELDDGNLAVIAGSGDDVVEIDDLTTGGVFISFGDGDDTLRLADGAALAGAEVEVVFGDGDDTFTPEGNTSANDEITLVFGDGDEDTLDLAQTADLTLGTVTATGLEVIDYGTDLTANVSDSVVDGLLLTGQTITLLGDADADADNIYSLLDVVIEADGTYDFSGITADRTLESAVDGLNVTVANTDNTITLTSARDVIDLGDGDVTVTTGGGADNITLGTGVNTVVIANGDSGIVFDANQEIGNTVLTIIDFDDAEDFLDLAVAGSASNYTEIDGAADATAAALLTAAEAEMDGTVKYVYVYAAADTAGTQFLAADGFDKGDSLLYVDTDLDGDAEMIISLNGITAAGDFAFGNII